MGTHLPSVGSRCEIGGLDFYGFPFLPCFCRHARNTAALKSYEQHLKKEGEVSVELFRFSEQSDLDVDKLTHKLGETSGSANVLAVSLLLALTGESSYMWLNSEHNPKHVKLCAMLKQRFPKKLNFVICPTSNETREKWEANKSQPQNIFGRFFDDNVSVFRGFKDDVASDSHIWELMCEGQVSDVVREKPEKSNFGGWLRANIMSVQLLCSIGCIAVLVLQLHANKAETAQLRADKEKLQLDLGAMQEELERCRSALENTSTLPQILSGVMAYFPRFATS